jgi:hypothetical protein
MWGGGYCGGVMDGVAKAIHREGNARFQEAYVTTLFPAVQRKRAPIKSNKYSMDLCM